VSRLAASLEESVVFLHHLEIAEHFRQHQVQPRRIHAEDQGKIPRIEDADVFRFVLAA
jgi:hypothetical protein